MYLILDKIGFYLNFRIYEAMWKMIYLKNITQFKIIK